MARRLFLLPSLLSAFPALACGAPAASPAPRAPLVTRPTPGGVEQEGLRFDHEHLVWTSILQRHVHGDGFDYAALKKNPGQLENYLESLHAVTPDRLAGWTKDQRFAFWINAYNAHTIKLIVDNYPLKSIKKLSGAFGLNSVFDKEFIEMRALHPGGKDDALSLNDIEHEILRKRFEDARVHAAVNCASYSCPPLRNEAFTAEKLGEQLDDQMRKFLADPKRNRLDEKKGVFRASKIFEWFSGDFERDAGSVKEYLAKYAPAKDAERIRGMRIKYLDYDWSLNEASPAD